jgi:hypothetical protein
VTVVVQIMDVKFKTAVSDMTDIAVGDLVALLWYDLKRGSEPIREVDIHKVRSELVARGSFHVVGQDEASGCSFGPKPNEGDPVTALGSHRKTEKSLV